MTTEDRIVVVAVSLMLSPFAIWLFFRIASAAIMRSWQQMLGRDRRDGKTTKEDRV